MAQFQTFYYEDGNAVRQYESIALPTREERQRELIQQKEQKIRARIQAHRRNKLRNRYQTFMFLCSVLMAGAFFVAYVHIQNNITTSMAHISSLEKQIADLKTENAAAKSRISTAANLGIIQRTAKKDLGMVYANSDQIVYYTIDDDDFMSQYEAVK